MTPDEPLNFIVSLQGKDRSSGAHMFEDQMREVAQGRSLGDIVAFLRSEANLRNQLLYAADGGIPSASFGEEFLLERLWRITVLLTLTVAIQQTPTHQLFAAQCLKAFLRMLPKVKGEDFEFRAPEPASSGIVVEKQPGGEPVAWFERRYTFQTTISYRMLPALHAAWKYEERPEQPVEEPPEPT
jgi:hypothetical protein